MRARRCHQGVVVQSEAEEGVEEYALASSLAASSTEGAAGAAGAAEEEEEGGESAAAAAQRKLLESMKVYESYVVGMLRNMPNLAAGRIHNMLKMFPPSGENKYDETEEQLELFLEGLVDAGTLESNGDAFKLA